MTLCASRFSSSRPILRVLQIPHRPSTTNRFEALPPLYPLQPCNCSPRRATGCVVAQLQRGKGVPLTGNCGTPERHNQRRPPPVPLFHCCKRVGGGGALSGFVSALPFDAGAHIEKLRGFRQAHSDLSAGRGSFSSPRHPYPLPLGPIRTRGTSTGLTLPSIQIFAATPLQGRAKPGTRGDGPAVAAGGHRAAFFTPRPVNVRFGQGHQRTSSRYMAANPLKIKRKIWWAL